MYCFGFGEEWKERMRCRRSTRWLRRDASVDLTSSPLPTSASSRVAGVVVGSCLSFVSPEVVDIFNCMTG